MNNLAFSQAIEGYLLNAGARHLSPHTIADYLNTFHKFEDYAEDDPRFVMISQNEIQEFLAAQTVEVRRFGWFPQSFHIKFGSKVKVRPLTPPISYSLAPTHLLTKRVFQGYSPREGVSSGGVWTQDLAQRSGRRLGESLPYFGGQSAGRAAIETQFEGALKG
jgi:hypothetical protein